MNGENSKVKKVDWGALVVILFLVATLFAAAFGIKIIFDTTFDDVGMFFLRSTFQYRVELNDFPDADLSNTYTILKFGDHIVEEGKRSMFDDESVKLDLRRVFASEGGNTSDRVLRAWVSEPTEFEISIYQSTWSRETGYVLGDLIKRETIRVTPWLFFFYSVEVIDTHVSTALSLQNILSRIN